MSFNFKEFERLIKEFEENSDGSNVVISSRERKETHRKDSSSLCKNIIASIQGQSQFINERNNERKTPLYIICESKIEDDQKTTLIKTLLLQGADPLIAGKDGIYPFDLCTQKDRSSLFSFEESTSRGVTVWKASKEIKKFVNELQDELRAMVKRAFYIALTSSICTDLTAINLSGEQSSQNQHQIIDIDSNESSSGKIVYTLLVSKDNFVNIISSKLSENAASEEFCEFGRDLPNGRGWKVAFNIVDKDIKRAWSIVRGILIKNNVCDGKFIDPRVCENLTKTDPGKQITIYTLYYLSRMGDVGRWKTILQEIEKELCVNEIGSNANKAENNFPIPGSNYMSYRNDYDRDFGKQLPCRCGSCGSLLSCCGLFNSCLGYERKDMPNYLTEKKAVEVSEALDTHPYNPYGFANPFKKMNLSPSAESQKKSCDVETSGEEELKEGEKDLLL